MNKKRDQHIMLDLETLGNSPDAAIKAIGAVKFNLLGVTDEFYMVVDLASAIAEGGKVNADTIEWWMRQDQEARKIFDMPGDGIYSALDLFEKWAEPKKNEIILWGNGAGFDNVILAGAYHRARIPQPWHYYNNRCYRTLKNLYPEIPIKRTGTHHNALDDARSQALHLIRILGAMKSGHPQPVTR